MLPPEVQAEFLDGFPWRIELDLWEPAVLASLPDGVRAPVLHRVVDLGDDRLAVWMEDVVGASSRGTSTATPAPHGRSARGTRAPARPSCSATLAAGFALQDVRRDRHRHPRAPAASATTSCGRTRGSPTTVTCARGYSPWATASPSCSAGSTTLPQAMPHGDASPQNLLVPASAPDRLRHHRRRHAHPARDRLRPRAAARRARARRGRAGGVVAVDRRTIVPAYVAGLRAEGDLDLRGRGRARASRSPRCYAAGSTRSSTTSSPSPRTANARTFAERVALCRFLADQAEAVLA